MAPTDIYILGIDDNEWKASGKGWSAWETGQTPNTGSVVFFDPSSHWNLDGEMIFRPFEMLESRAVAHDAEGCPWRFAPFHFLDPEDRRGSPLWPRSIPGDSERTDRLRDTDQLTPR